MGSDEFAAMWAAGDVADSTDHRLEIYTPDDASSANALRILAHQSLRNTEPQAVRRH